jgi:hypothetical protein
MPVGDGIEAAGIHGNGWHECVNLSVWNSTLPVKN